MRMAKGIGSNIFNAAEACKTEVGMAGYSKSATKSKQTTTLHIANSQKEHMHAYSLADMAVTMSSLFLNSDT
jgi:hypothetical protein